jgi:hypothetical protein
MLGPIPFGSAGEMMADCRTQPQRIAQVIPQGVFPKARSIAISAPAVSQNQQFRRVRVVSLTIRSPSPNNRIHGKFRRVCGGADEDVPSIANRVINAVGNRNPLG